MKEIEAQKRVRNMPKATQHNSGKTVKSNSGWLIPEPNNF